MQTDDIATWLTAIWDEDEKAAKAADVKQGDPRWVTNHIALAHPRAFRVRSALDKRPIATVEDVAGDDDADTTGILDGEAAAAHIARHDPAAVLARIAADRQILALGICAACDIEDQPCDHRESTLRLLASAHADRPGYNEDWRPAPLL